jgi:serine/threonine-protein kinase HipA
MPDVSVLDVLLYEERVGTLTLVQGSRTLFAFNKAYADNLDRSTLSLSFKDQFGQLLTDIPPTNTRVPPFFANLLPEGPLREYLARQAGVNEQRELPPNADKQAGEARNKRRSYRANCERPGEILP